MSPDNRNCFWHNKAILPTIYKTSAVTYNSEKPSSEIISDTYIGNKKSEEKISDKNPAKDENYTSSYTERSKINFKTRLGIVDIKPYDVGETLSDEMTNILLKNLQTQKGKDRVFSISKNRNDKNINRQLLGRITKLGDKYIININVTDTQNGNILYSKTSTFSDLEKRGIILSKIAKEINTDSKIWE